MRLRGLMFVFLNTNTIYYSLDGKGKQHPLNLMTLKTTHNFFNKMPHKQFPLRR